MSTIVCSYTAVWRPGTGQQFWFTGSPSAFAAKDQELFAKNLRLTAIDRHYATVGNDAGSPWVINPPHEDRMIGVWHSGTGEQHWQSGLTIDAFKAADATYFAKGLRLTAVDTSQGAVTAVWRPGTGTQHWASGLSVADFTALDTQYFAQGFRLAAIDVDTDGSFFGVWRTGAGPQQCASGSLDAIIQKNKQYVNQGLRMTALDHNQGQYVAVWHAGAGAEYWWTGLTVDQFKQKDAAYFAEGLHLVAVDIGTVALASSPTPSPVPTIRGLALQQNAPYSGAGGANTWMYYSATVPAADPQASKKVTTVANPTNFELGVSRQGLSVGLAAHSSTSFFAGEPLEGLWSAELIGVQGLFAPTSLPINVSIA